MIRKKDMEFLCGVMGGNMKGCGLMGNSTEEEFIRQLKAFKKKLSGKKAKEFTGTLLITNFDKYLN